MAPRPLIQNQKNPSPCILKNIRITSNGQIFFQVKVKDDITTLRKTEAGVPQGSVLGPVLHLIYTSDLPTSDITATATFADDTAILTTCEDPAIAFINKIDDWAKKWRIKINRKKSTHITFTLCNQTCPTVQMGNVDLLQKNEVKYLGMHLDRRLKWAKHIKSERKQISLKAKQMNWLLGRSTL
jgi:metal-sulfur cluster biosynthetic enzyme